MAAAFLPVGLFITAFAVVFLALVALRRPYLRRMGTRHFTRRPAETVLIVAGSILGTALIVGSFITNDSLTRSLTQKVYDQNGEVDEVVTLSTNAAANRAEQRLPAIRRAHDVDGAILVESAGGTTRNSDNVNLTEPRTNVYSLNTAEVDRFGSLRQSVGGPALGADEAIVNSDLAKELDLHGGDQVQLLLFGHRRDFRVARIATGTGFAQYGGGKTIFVAPGVIDDMAAGSIVGAHPRHELWVSNKGDTVTGNRYSFVVAGELQNVMGSNGVDVNLLKNGAVERAQTAADAISQLFLVTGTFAVVAGVLLLVNIFVMLAAERKSEMGMLRAIGMRRSDLVRGFVLEGAMYGAAASVIGCIAGIGVGAAIVAIASVIFQNSVTGQPTSIALALVPRSIVAGGFVGFSISFVTILVTSLRISRINIIAAVRDIDVVRSKQPKLRTMAIGLAAVVLGVLITSVGLSATQAVPALVGPAIVGIGLVPLLSRLMPKRLMLSLIGLGVASWGILVPALMPDIMRQASGPATFVVQGLVTTFAAVIVLSQNQEILSSLVRRLARTSPKRGLAARLATTYPVARRFRTAMTLIMYSLIVFTLVLITTIAHVNDVNTQAFARRESSGYDVLVRTNPATPVTYRDLAKTSGVVGGAGVQTSPVTLKQESEDKQAGGVAYGVDPDFLRLMSYSMTDWDKKYPTPQAVWLAVENNPNLVVIDRTYAPGRNQGPPGAMQVKLGEELKMIDPVSGREVTRKVVGYSNSVLAFPGAFISSRALKDQFAAVGTTVWLVRVDPLVGAQTVAEQLKADNVNAGLQANAFKELIQDVMALQLQFFGLLRGFLALGLIVGIIGLGVIMIRAVRERRRAIGVLRALGFAAGTVRRAFIGEAGLVATEGIFLGVGLAIVTARNLLSSGAIAQQFDVPFAVPWNSIFILAGLSLVFSLLVAALPARSASRIRPAVALRIAD